MTSPTLLKQLRLTPNYNHCETVITNETLFHGVITNPHGKDESEVEAYNTDEVFKYHLPQSPYKVINSNSGIVLYSKGKTIIHFETPVTLETLLRDLVWK